MSHDETLESREVLTQDMAAWITDAFAGLHVVEVQGTEITLRHAEGFEYRVQVIR